MLAEPFQLLEYKTDVSRSNFDTLGKSTPAHRAGALYTAPARRVDMLQWRSDYWARPTRRSTVGRGRFRHRYQPSSRIRPYIDDTTALATKSLVWCLCNQNGQSWSFDLWREVGWGCGCWLLLMLLPCEGLNIVLLSVESGLWSPMLVLVHDGKRRGRVIGKLD